MERRFQFIDSNYYGVWYNNSIILRFVVQILYEILGRLEKLFPPKNISYNTVGVRPFKIRLAENEQGCCAKSHPIRKQR